MDAVRKFGWLIVLTGCPTTADTDSGGYVDSDTTPQNLLFNFNATTPAVDFTAGVSEASLAAHEISNMVLASTSIVVADQAVQDRLNTDGGGGFLRAVAVQCWDRPQFPMFSFTIDYTPCANYQMGGGVFINDHPSGPLLFEYSNFAINERTLGGVLGFDTRDAFPEPLYWQVYNTAGENPGLDNLVPLGVTLSGTPYGVSYLGGASISFLEGEWAMWGVMTVEGGKDTIEVVHGAADASDVAPDEPTGVDVLTSSTNWLSCRCPTSGVESQDVVLHFEQVNVDIDDLEDIPDGVDDPDLEIEVNFDAPGHLVLDRTGCGTYDPTYTSDAVSIALTSEQLQGAISFKCSTFEIADEARCNALLSAAGRVGGVEVEITPEQMQATAEEAVLQDFDSSWCVVQ